LLLRRGIIYMSRVPPFMKPVKVRHLMSQHGKIGKIFLRPEDERVAKKRKSFGGNRKTNYVEGWVEFEDKRVARRVAEQLNGTQVGGKKGSFHYEDIWTMLYLPKFKWHHLTERIAYENAVRVKRLQAEDAQVRRETNAYVEQVSKAKRNEAQIKKGLKRPQAAEEAPVRRIKLRKPIPSKEA
jgi:ESF2/ABP1 family protein